MAGSVKAASLPDGALLERYRDMTGAHADCYSLAVGRPVEAAEYIEAFYTTWLFRCERLVLKAIGRGCTDEDIRALATGKADAFAAWTVEARSANQLLVCDFAGLTRSWLMVAARTDGRPGTQLYFGSAVVPRAKSRRGAARPSAGFRLLLPVHAWYSHGLLQAAAAKLRQAP